jgi:DNA-binding response OmpR family regulator
MSDHGEWLTDGPVSLHLSDGEAVAGKRRVTLTPVESNLLGWFLQNRTVPLSRRRLIEGVWGQNYQGSDHNLSSHIQRLRRKLGRFGRFIRTVRAVGYRWDSSVKLIRR